MATAVLGLASMKAGAQGMAVNTTGATADASAVFDASSTSQGMLIPRMTNAQMTAISSPATGLLVYCTNCSPIGFYFYNGSWVSLSSSAGTASGDLTGSYPNPTIAATSGTGTNVVNAINASTSVIHAANLGTGSSITTKFLRGDNTWQTTGGGSGTVTSVSSGTLTSGTTAYTDTLYHSVVINATTTPAIFYVLNNASAYSVWTNNTSAPAIPRYGKVNPLALYAPGGGTPSSSTFYRGDGSWQSISTPNPDCIGSKIGIGAVSAAYSALFGLATSTVNSNTATTLMPRDGTLANFYAYVTGNIVGSGSNSVTGTVYVNGVATALSVTFSISSVSTANQFLTTAQDVAHTVSISAGDQVYIQWSQSLTSGGTPNIAYTFTYQ